MNCYLATFFRFTFILLACSPELSISFSASPAKKASMSGLSAAELLNAALTAHKSGDYQSALVGYNSLLSMPLTPSAASTICSNAGAILMALGDYSSAKEYFEKGIKSQPDNPQSHFNLAVILTSKLSLHTEALEHLNIAADLGYDKSKILHLKGNVLQDLGRSEEASECYATAESEATVSPEQSGSKLSSHIREEALVAVREKLGHCMPGDVISAELEGRMYSMRCISKRPLLFYVKSLVSDSECDFIVEKSRGTLQRSEVMGGSVTYSPTEKAEETVSEAANISDPFRLSYNAWLPQEDMLLNIQARISALTGLSSNYVRQHSEELQVLRYPAGGRFKVHHDSSKFHPRLLTALFYLNTLPDSLLSSTPKSVSGGTWFPYSSSTSEQLLSCPSTTEDAIVHALSLAPEESSIRAFEEVDANEGHGALILPSKGDAIVFFNHMLDDDHPIDPSAVHAGLPLLFSAVPSSSSSADSTTANNDQERALPDFKIEKWVANYWITF